MASRLPRGRCPLVHLLGFPALPMRSCKLLAEFTLRGALSASCCAFHTMHSARRIRCDYILIVVMPLCLVFQHKLDIDPASVGAKHYSSTLHPTCQRLPRRTPLTQSTEGRDCMQVGRARRHKAPTLHGTGRNNSGQSGVKVGSKSAQIRPFGARDPPHLASWPELDRVLPKLPGMGQSRPSVARNRPQTW